MHESHKHNVEVCIQVGVSGKRERTPARALRSPELFFPGGGCLWMLLQLLTAQSQLDNIIQRLTFHLILRKDNRAP